MAVLIAELTGAEPVAVVGRGTGIDDEGWMRKTAAVRDALRRDRPFVREPVSGTQLRGCATCDTFRPEMCRMWHTVRQRATSVSPDPLAPPSGPSVRH